jgi:hypothetical protein
MLFRFVKIVLALLLLLHLYGPAAAQAEVQHKTEVQEPCWTSTTSPASDLLSRRVSLGSTPESLFALINRLQDQGLPLSFIDSFAGEEFAAQTREQSVRILLRDLVERFPVYRCQVIDGRVVLFPQTEDRRYEATVGGLEIEGVPRYPAARQLVQHFNKSVAGLHDLVEPLLAGIAEAPVYTEPVSLARSGTVLEHLVQLLGENPKVFFVITRAKSGLPILLLGDVP